jgi:hypothetical protein
MNQETFLSHLAERLEGSGIPFMVAGSFSSSHHGQPRASNDIDLVIDPTEEHLQNFVRQLGAEYYVSPEAVHDALARRSMFNVIHLESGMKADLIVRKNRPFSAEEFRRRQPVTMLGRPVYVATPEDVILTKLEWNKITPSDRQLQDALQVAIVQGSRLDWAYLQHWAGALGLEQDLESLRLRIP